MKTCDSTDAQKEREVEHMNFCDNMWSQSPNNEGEIHLLRIAVSHLLELQQILVQILLICIKMGGNLQPIMVAKTILRAICFKMKMIQLILLMLMMMCRHLY